MSASGKGHKQAGAGSSELAVAILVGGQSSRMGSNKALEELDGRPLLEHVLRALSPLDAPTFLVGDNAEAAAFSGLAIHPDLYPARASLVGVYSAIAASPEPLCFVTACDMPFIRPALAGLLLEKAYGYDAVIPVSESGAEPLCALYSRTCLEQMRRSIEAGCYSIRGPLAELNVRHVPVEELRQLGDLNTIFFNVNRQAELRQAERLRAAGRADGAPAPLVCFVGKKDSGKTTFIEKLVRLLVAGGVEVAYIKHDVHGFDIDREGTDTYRLAAAGSRQVIISSPSAIARMERVREEKDLDALRRDVGPVDIVIAEGFKTSCADRIEVSRAARSDSLACREEDLMAVVSDRPQAASTVPLFGLDDVAGVAQLLARRYSLVFAVGARAAPGSKMP